DDRVPRDTAIATIPLQICKFSRSERAKGSLCGKSPTSLGAVEDEPRRHRSWVLPLRMLLAGLLITVLTGGAVATAGLLELNDFTDEFKELSHEAPLQKGT